MMTEDPKDPKISKRYRELPRDEPPASIDDAILAAARRAARMRPAPLVPPTGRLRWYFPVAAAAIIVLAVAVTMHVERDRPDPEALTAAPPAPAAAERMQEAPVAENAPAKPEPRARLRQSKPQVFAPDPQPPTPAARDSIGSASSQRSESQDPTARAPAAAISGAALTPERWLEEIALLREQGKHEAADEALADFKRRYPDYRIPDATLKRIEKK